MVTGDEEHDVFTQVRALSMEVKPSSCLINIDDMGSTRVEAKKEAQSQGLTMTRDLLVESEIATIVGGLDTTPMSVRHLSVSKPADLG